MKARITNFVSIVLSIAMFISQIGVASCKSGSNSSDKTSSSSNISGSFSEYASKAAIGATSVLALVLTVIYGIKFTEHCCAENPNIRGSSSPFPTQPKRNTGKIQRSLSESDINNTPKLTQLAHIPKSASCNELNLEIHRDQLNDNSEDFKTKVQEIICKDCYRVTRFLSWAMGDNCYNPINNKVKSVLEILHQNYRKSETREKLQALNISHNCMMELLSLKFPPKDSNVA